MMEHDTGRFRLFTRRALLLGGIKLSLTSALAARLYYLQVVEADKFATLAEDNRINMRLLPPPRGQITDRFGVPLAFNQQNFKVVLVPEQAGDVEAALDAVASVTDMDEAERTKVMRDMRRQRPFNPVTVKEGLSWDQVARLEVMAPDLPGVSIEVGEIRFYPYRDATSHVLGYVGAVSEKEMTEGDPVLTLPGFRIGKDGIEKIHEAKLRGTAGRTKFEVNALGRVIRELDRQEGKPGNEIHLTLDIGLQQYAMQRLTAEKSATAVVMDVVTGDIYAMASSPGFDPNEFTLGIPTSVWQRHMANEGRPLRNKTVSDHYPPGSTFKMMTAAAILEAGISPKSTVFCGGKIRLGSYEFNCWKKGGHGHMDMVSSLKESCDVYYYEMARKIGFDRVAAVSRRFGLGDRTGLGLPGEIPGTIPDSMWKKARYGQPWTQGDSINASIGQGYVEATPLQLAVMTARIANGQYAVQPRLVTAIDDTPVPAPEFAPLNVSPAHMQVIRDGMLAVMREGGTAVKSRIADPQFEMAGKTGTSQVRRITAAQRAAGVPKAQDVPWKERDHGLFVAYAPAHAPRYAIAVVVEHGGGGSSAAAPIARDIMLDCQKRDPARVGPVATTAPTTGKSGDAAG